MSQRIFITGIAGFLGSHLADRLLAMGHSVAGCDNLSGGERSSVPDAAAFFEVDCCDLPAMIEIIQADVVVHAAASAHEGLSVFSPTAIVRDNSQASVATFTAAIANSVKRIVYCSSMARYGENTPPFVESMPTAPVDPYGIAKVASEQLLQTLCTVHGVEWAIAVPHNIVGARQKFDDPYRNVASIMANLMLQGRQPFIYGDGSQQRCFSPIDDVIDGLVQLALEPDAAGMLVNLGPDNGFVTILELADRIARVVGFAPLEPVFFPDRPCEVRSAYCSATLARERLGYREQRTLDDALGEIVAYIRAQGPRPFSYHFDLEIVSEIAPPTWRDRLL